MAKTLIESIGKPILDRIIDRMEYLWARWQDEKEYEDFQDYIDNVKTVLPEGSNIVKMTKRPFQVNFEINNGTGIGFVKVSSREISWGRVA